MKCGCFYVSPLFVQIRHLVQHICTPTKKNNGEKTILGKYLKITFKKLKAIHQSIQSGPDSRFKSVINKLKSKYLYKVERLLRGSGPRHVVLNISEHSYLNY